MLNKLCLGYRLSKVGSYWASILNFHFNAFLFSYLQCRSMSITVLPVSLYGTWWILMEKADDSSCVRPPVQDSMFGYSFGGFYFQKVLC